MPHGKRRPGATRAAIADDYQHSRAVRSRGGDEIEQRSLDEAKLGVAAAYHVVSLEPGCYVGITGVAGCEIQHPMLMRIRTDAIIDHSRGNGRAEIGLLRSVAIEHGRDRVGIWMIPGADALHDLGFKQTLRTQQQLRAVHCASTEKYVSCATDPSTISSKVHAAGVLNQTVSPMDNEPSSASAVRSLYLAGLRQGPDVGERPSIAAVGVFNDGEIIEIERVLGLSTTAEPALAAHVALALLAPPVIFSLWSRTVPRAAGGTSRPCARALQPPA